MVFSKLSQRLSLVAEQVPEGSRLLDVGSDHAYLPIALMEAGRIVAAVAGEVVAGPYQSAVANVAEQGLSDKIQVRLASGLAAMKETDAISAISICGMGGRLIADILEAGKAQLTGQERLILQPNNREDDLRAWLVANGYELIRELIMTEQGKFYEILVAEKGQQQLNDRDLRFGPHLRRDKSPVFVAKWQRELDKLETALSQIPADRLSARQPLLDKLATIKEVLDAG